MNAPGVLLVLAFLVLASGVPGRTPALVQGASQPAAGGPVVMPAGDLKWVDLDPKGAPGAQVANLWGDYRKGPFGAFFKLPAGFAAPLHTHTHEMRVVFVSGTYIQAPEGKPEFRLGPGSYLLQPGGNYQHTTSCDAAADCVFLVESGGAFDLHVVEPAKAPGKDR